jgi:transposase
VCVQGFESQDAENGPAWAIKTLGMKLWNDACRSWAKKKGWTQWYAWTKRSCLAPIKTVAHHQETSVGHSQYRAVQANNRASESMNSRIQVIKIRSCGFRIMARNIQAIYFHLGELAPSPEWVRRQNRLTRFDEDPKIVAPSPHDILRL